MANHRSLTESVLERGEALLDCMASNSPGEEERGSGAGHGHSQWQLPPRIPARLASVGAGKQWAVCCSVAVGAGGVTDTLWRGRVLPWARAFLNHPKGLLGEPRFVSSLSDWSLLGHLPPPPGCITTWVG